MTDAKNNVAPAPSLGQAAWGLPVGRTALTLALAAVLVVVVGAVHHYNDDVSGMATDRYWVTKTDWRHCADVVLTGDSRVQVGLSPSEMERYLPGMRIRNYGFAGLGYCDAYLDAVERVLDPHSRRRTIVVGVSPHALTPGAAALNGFHKNMYKGEFEKTMIRHFGEVLHFLRPLQMHEIRGFFSDNGVHYKQELKPDGWLAAVKTPENPREALADYRGVVSRDGKVSPAVIERLLLAVSRWRSKGITVYGFRPPSTVEMTKLEEELLGFNEPEFVAKFEQAGGIWIPSDCRYRSYDGSHLHRDSAIELSRNLARQIQVATASALRQ